MKALELSHEQRQQWEASMSYMMWTAPGFRHLFYRLLANNSGKYVAVFTDEVPVAATDAKNILVNPNTFFEYKMKERIFILCHEVGHNMLGDVEFRLACLQRGYVPCSDGTTLPYDEDTIQRAMDYRLNAILRDSRLGTPPKDCCLDDKIGTADDSVLDVYQRLYEQNEGGGRGWAGNGPSGFDTVLDPGTSTGDDPADHKRNDRQWAVEVATAEMLEKMQGDMPGALQRMFKEILDPEVPWIDHIRHLVQKRTGMGTYSWRKPDRRFIGRDLYMPSPSGFGAGKIVVWGDTSGSIGAQELMSYLAEFKGILEDVKPRVIQVYWCDADIQRVDDITDALDLDKVLGEGAPGGGGTSVHPVFEAIDNSTDVPELFIGFTDLYVDLPPVAPAYPVIWACTTDKTPPWGECVRINTRNGR